VLSKLAYLTLCRSIQLLALLARGDAAKDLEILASAPGRRGVDLPAPPHRPAAGIVACDFFAVDSIWLRRL
jgi:hypothetical protein